MQLFICPRLIDYLTIALVLLMLVCVGCAGPSGGSADPAPPSAGVPSTPVTPTTTPVQQGEAVGNDIGETVNEALDNAVDTVKGRDDIMVRRGVFFSVGIRNLERSEDFVETRTADNTEIGNVSVGYDQAIATSWVAGVALDFANRDSSSPTSLDFSTTSDTGSIYIFTSYEANLSTSYSAYAGFGSSNLSSSRTTRSGTLNIVDGTDNSNVELPILAGDVSGSSNSSIFSAGLAVKRIVFRNGRDQISVGADIDYSSVTTDAYEEQGSTNTELAYREHTKEELRFVLSASANRVYNSSVGVIVPGISLSYVNKQPDENLIFADLIADRNQSTGINPPRTDRGFGELDLDIVWVRPGGWQFFANFNTNFQNDFEESRGAKIGGRREF